MDKSELKALINTPYDYQDLRTRTSNRLSKTKNVQHQKYDINSLPTALKLVDGEAVDMKVGMISAENFREWIAE